MAEYIPFKLYERDFRYYSVDRIDSEFQNITGNWRPIKFSNERIYKCIQFRVDGKKYNMRLHRVIYYAHNQEWNIYDNSKNNYIDHICHQDGVPLDNSITNLRVVNHQQNNFNRNCKGYYFDKECNKYRSRIKLNGKTKFLGLFDTADEARNAYLEAKKIYHIIET
jgi:hypothetical protein